MLIVKKLSGPTSNSLTIIIIKVWTKVHQSPLLMIEIFILIEMNLLKNKELYHPLNLNTKWIVLSAVMWYSETSLSSSSCLPAKMSFYCSAGIPSFSATCCFKSYIVWSGANSIVMVFPVRVLMYKTPPFPAGLAIFSGWSFLMIPPCSSYNLSYVSLSSNTWSFYSKKYALLKVCASFWCKSSSNSFLDGFLSTNTLFYNNSSLFNINTSTAESHIDGLKNLKLESQNTF